MKENVTAVFSACAAAVVLTACSGAPSESAISKVINDSVATQIGTQVSMLTGLGVSRDAIVKKMGYDPDKMRIECSKDRAMDKSQSGIYSGDITCSFDGIGKKEPDERFHVNMSKQDGKWTLLSMKDLGQK